MITFQFFFTDQTLDCTCMQRLLRFLQHRYDRFFEFHELLALKLTISLHLG